MFHVHDGTAAYRLFDGFLDVFAVPPQEALAVDRALVLAVQASVYNVAHGPSGDWMQLQPTSCKPQASSCKKEQPPPLQAVTWAAMPTPGSLQLAARSLPLYCDFLTRRYHSDSRRTCLSV
ncbi:hypothetical protein D3C80_1752460 [compost metagenome]